MEVCLLPFIERRSEKRQLTGQAFVENQAQRIDITALVLVLERHPLLRAIYCGVPNSAPVAVSGAPPKGTSPTSFAMPKSSTLAISRTPSLVTMTLSGFRSR